MAFFKSITRKIVTDVKEVVKEEGKKTTDEFKQDVASGIKEILPDILVVVGFIGAIVLIKKPTPVVVKVVLKQV